MIVLTKPLVAMAGDETIRRVPQETRDEPKDTRHGPRPAQQAGNFQCCIAFAEDAVRRDEQHGVRLGGIQTFLPIDLAADLGLNRGKVNNSPLIMPQDELHGSIAEMANAIKE